MKWELAALVSAVMVGHLGAAERAQPGNPPTRWVMGLFWLTAMVVFLIVGLITD